VNLRLRLITYMHSANGMQAPPPAEGEEASTGEEAR
jgi:hypothetical protein